VEEIDLSNQSKFNGGIFALDENVFEELKYLKKLNLADNQIETIDSNIFDHFIDFNDLNLSNNKLKPINGKFFEDLGDVQAVSFFNNPEQMDPFVLFKEIFDKNSLNIELLGSQSIYRLCKRESSKPRVRWPNRSEFDCDARCQC